MNVHDIINGNSRYQSATNLRNELHELGMPLSRCNQVVSILHFSADKIRIVDAKTITKVYEKMIKDFDGETFLEFFKHEFGPTT